MKRRDFLKVASGAAGGAAAVGTTSASSDPSLSNQEGTTTTGDGSGGGGTQTTDGGGTQTTGGGGGGGGTETVEVGPNGEFVFKPGTSEPLAITPGTTVNFVWKSDTHNIVVESQPEEANWEGHEPIEDTGFEYSHTFEVEGTYEYYCQPHQQAGMVGTIEVSSDAGGGGSAPAKQDPHEMGVPFQAHFVGIATILMMFVSLVYTFFVLKYGESRHASAPNKK